MLIVVHFLHLRFFLFEISAQGCLQGQLNYILAFSVRLWRNQAWQATHTRSRCWRPKNIFWLGTFSRLCWVSVSKGGLLQTHLKSTEHWGLSILVRTWLIYKSVRSSLNFMSKTIFNFKCVNFHSWFSHHQARGCILVASSPEILTRVKKVNKYIYSFLFTLYIVVTPKLLLGCIWDLSMLMDLEFSIAFLRYFQILMTRSCTLKYNLFI